MSVWPRHPVFYEINTAVWLNELSRKEGHPVTLGNVPDRELGWLASRFDGVWLMGVWQRSPEAREADARRPELVAAFDAVLPGWTQEDVAGSPFAIHGYEVDPAWGGEKELAAFRDLLRRLGLRLILDFVPNHLALDHPWLAEHPDWLVQGTEEDLRREPANYFASEAGGVRRIFAHGRDPLFPGWPDTVQVDLRRPGARRALRNLLLSVTDRCDGVRCDMAMLVTREIFLRTWGGSFEPDTAELWPEVIAAVKTRHPDFLMMAEVYWDLEPALLAQGFDYAYDKRLYDRLSANDMAGVKAHLAADLEYQQRLVRFVENHDEERAAARFGLVGKRAAAALALTLPGARLLHQGQLEGARAKLPVQLGRAPAEEPDPRMKAFYEMLLKALRDPVFHEGAWRRLEPMEGWGGKATHVNLVAYLWILVRAEETRRRLVVVNLSASPAQGLVRVNLPDLAGAFCELTDRMNGAVYGRDGDGLRERGLSVSLPGYGVHLFDLRLSSEARYEWTPVENQPGFRSVLWLPSHEVGIYSLSWSPDGKQLATGSASGHLLVRNLENPRVRCLKAHLGEVSALAWSPNGRTLASGSFDRSIMLWDLEDGSVRSLRAHTDNVLALAWSPDGSLLASGSTDQTVCLWRGEELFQIHRENRAPVNSLAWSPDGRYLAGGIGDNIVRFWDKRGLLALVNVWDWVGSLAWSPDGRHVAVGTGQGLVALAVETGPNSIKLLNVFRIQGHTSRVLSVAFSADERLWASKSADGTVRLWRTEDRVELASLSEAGEYLSGLAFHPSLPWLATRDDATNSIRIWELDLEALLGRTAATSSVSSVNAKVVLVGDSGVGKSGLGVAMAEGKFRPTASTHGAQFWQIPMERPAALPENVQAEITLWDLAGQPEYRLVHQLFLDDTDAALLLFDGSNPADPFRGVSFWSRVLQKHLRLEAPKLLVAARCDVSPVTADPRRIQPLLDRFGLAAVIRTSAFRGEGIDDLKAWLRESIPWADLPVTTEPLLFQAIRAFLLQRKEAGQSLLSAEEIREAVRRQHPDQEATAEKIGAVVGLLQSQGLVQKLGPHGVLLRPELVNQYAASIIQAARNHPDGLGAVGEREVLIANLPFDGVDRLPADKERIVLEATVELLIEHDLCFREMGWLVFPSQVSASRPDPPQDQPRAEVAYQFSGSFETVFASLVVRLSLTRYFRREDLWRYAAEFSRDGHRLGFAVRQLEEGAGEIEIYFAPEIGEFDRVTFIRFVTDHLATKGFDIQERIRLLRCPSCGREVRDEEAIEENVRAGHLDIPCQYCRSPILIPRSIEERYRLDPSYREKQRDLAAAADQRKEEAVSAFVTEREEIQPKSDPVLHILHLSDLHLRTAEQGLVYRMHLETDLRMELEVRQLDYLVLSGDFADRGSADGFTAAFELVDNLVRRFGLRSDRVIVVPGNHDVSWDLAAAAYQYVPRHQLPKQLGETFIEAGPAGALRRDEALYKQRFAPFNSLFYKKIYGGQEYPLDYELQASVLVSSEHQILFLALNSAWQIDHHYTGRASIHREALARALEPLMDGAYDGWLKIAVWHHPVTGPEGMDDAFVEQLVVNGFRIGMHGHIHKAQDELFRYEAGRGLAIVGAGTFGAPAEQQVTGIPLQYNLLRLDRDKRTLTVFTRKKERPDGAWSADARWGKRDPKAYYEIKL